MLEKLSSTGEFVGNNNYSQQQVEQAREVLNTILSFSQSSLDKIEFYNGDAKKDITNNTSIILEAMSSNSPIEMLLPAFPAKSPNRNKTISHLPDLGEYLGLKRLNLLCEEILYKYDGGAQITICSDGRVFGDIVNVSDTMVNEYNASIRQMIDKHNFTNLKIFTLDDHFDIKDFQKMRDDLRKKYGQSLDTIRQQVLSDKHEKSLFNGLHKFVFEDIIFGYGDASRNKIRKLSKEITYQVIQSSHAWSSLVASIFPKTIRLSIHPYAIGSGKISISLVPSASRWATPWHNVVLKDKLGYRLVKKHEAIEEGAQLIEDEYGYKYFACQTIIATQ
ncbi:MAG: L-tyrosine/L-tryptophan isonitrile synthase family protein [Gammaproteobacteria bacterium]|nr:L-tyrosine/L-tryptophan isonitrile synthase family protein [Gammaproteobacteria bacterium]